MLFPLLCGVLSALTFAFAVAPASGVTSCGGEGQRACCPGELIQDHGACDLDDTGKRLTEVDFECHEDECLCGGFNPFGTKSNSMCVKATPCGGEGQRACCLGELINVFDACKPGLVPATGCSGDCLCGGTANPGHASRRETCEKVSPDPIAEEPTANWKSTAVTPPRSLRGYADLHAHLFAQFAHGGNVFAGSVAQIFGGSVFGVGNADSALHSALDSAVHGNHGIVDPTPPIPGEPPRKGDAVGFGTEDNAIGNAGAPYFSNWPTYRSTTHQQMYYKWLERAWRGGLRLMVMLAITNEALCKGTRGSDCETSMLPPDRLGDLDKFDEKFRAKDPGAAPALPPVERQLGAAYRFEEFIDVVARREGHPEGWLRIVTTPQEARQAILDGKLAVVLGIEVDHLFGCRFKGPCTADDIKRAVDKYYEKGVRHIFPIHNFDNQYGGSATWQNAINVGNRVASGHWWDVDNCADSGYGFWLNHGLLDGLIAMFSFGITDRPFYNAGVASCNTIGLDSRLGEVLLDKLMDRGIVIDIDHMSSRSLEATIALAKQRHYPLVAGHALFLDLHRKAYVVEDGKNEDGAGAHERMRTREQLEEIKALGGMVAVMLKDDVQDTGLRGTRVTLSYGDKVIDDCLHSTKTWAQAYQYAVDTTLRKLPGGRLDGGVAFGSDFNGIAGHVGPRFGSEGCGGQARDHLTQLRAGNRLEYPFNLGAFGEFDRQQTGFKVFDFNVDGLAHVGLLPDMIADLRYVGLSAGDLEPLFRSAEEYIKVWERSEGARARDDSYAVTSDTLVVPADQGVIFNDMPGLADKRQYRAALKPDSGPGRGTLTFNPDGSFTYVRGTAKDGDDHCPPPGPYCGPDRFQYDLCSLTHCSTATVNLQVVNDAPAAYGVGFEQVFGAMVRARYQYFDPEGDPERGTIFKWFGTDWYRPGNPELLHEGPEDTFTPSSFLQVTEVQVTPGASRGSWPGGPATYSSSATPAGAAVPLAPTEYLIDIDCSTGSLPSSSTAQAVCVFKPSLVNLAFATPLDFEVRLGIRENFGFHWSPATCRLPRIDGFADVGTNTCTAVLKRSELADTGARVVAVAAIAVDGVLVPLRGPLGPLSIPFEFSRDPAQ